MFLDDIDLIAENAIEYNCDLAYETNRIICHRARALQDFVYALVKSEMDTDFEEECKDIVKRRKEAEAKLKKIDKELAKVVPPSLGKMQDMLAIVSTACQVENHYHVSASSYHECFVRFVTPRMTTTLCCCVMGVTMATTPTAQCLL